MERIDMKRTDMERTARVGGVPSALSTVHGAARIRVCPPVVGHRSSWIRKNSLRAWRALLAWHAGNTFAGVDGTLASEPSTVFTGAMEGVRLRLQAWGRVHWRSALMLAAVAGVVAGTVLALAIGARRTTSAPDRYTAAVGGDPDLGLHQPFGPPLQATIADLPTVSDVDAFTFVAAFPAGRNGAELDGNPFAGDDRARGGRVVDGRFTDPAAADEFTINRAAADAFGFGVGERFPIRSFSAEQVGNNEFRPGVAPEGPSFEATVVGIIEYPADLDDDTPTVIFSEGVLSAHPDIGIVATLMAVDGASGVDRDTLLGDVRAAAGDLEVFEGDASIVTAGARRAVALHARALWIVTVVAAVIAVLILTQLAVHQQRAGQADHGVLRALGYHRQQIVAEAALEAVAVGAVAALFAVTLATALSGAFPVGVLEVVEPDPGVRVDLPALLAGSLVIIAAFVLAAVVSAASTANQARPSIAPPGGLAELVAAAGAGPSMVNGVRFASSSPGAGRARPVLMALAVVVTLAGLVGALVAGISLVRMIDEPALWGADYDAIYGNPFVPAERDLVTPVAADPDVAGLTAATHGSIVLEGRDVSVLAFEAVRGDIRPVLLSGRVPAAPDEIALGRVLSRQLDRSIGDTVTAATVDGDEYPLRVVGETVTASDGGDGASMTFEGYQALDPNATRNLLLIDYRDGSNRDAVAARITDVAFTPPETTQPPKTVKAFERVVPAPFALAVVLAVMGAAVIAYQLATSVRRRARDFAVLRALGATGRQLRATIQWQACVLAAVGVLLGIPVGVVIGTRVHVAVADSVGVVPSVVVPIGALVAVAAGVLIVASVSAVVPARWATRSPIALLDASVRARR